MASSAVVLLVCTFMAMQAMAAAEAYYSGDDGVTMQMFEEWMAKFGKAYTCHGEKEHRFAVFRDNFYSSGVFPGPCGCGTGGEPKPNHAVTLVGYCQDGATGKKYWVAKNSWGKTWGQQGYILLEKDVASPHGTCGLAVSPFYPTA
uniref:Peptidase C1A papain C-terminal domain-containing protein n=1 Tax=Oryza brachyantha TaxID=4533 RepID=J3KZF5_ORYBR